MECKLERPIRIPVSSCGADGRMSLPGIFSLFMDMASEHGSAVGLGMEELSAKGIIWLAAKTILRIREYPRMILPVQAATWPEAPGRVRCNRYYALHREGELLVEGKTEWVMLEAATGKLCRTDEHYPKDLEHCPDVACDVPFSRLSDDFDACPELLRYTVCSSDIDVSRHMNNVAYVRAALGALSSAEREALRVSEAEAIYRIQCYEGEVLSIRRRDTESGLKLGVVKADGKTAMILRLKTE